MSATQLIHIAMWYPAVWNTDKKKIKIKIKNIHIGCIIYVGILYMVVLIGANVSGRMCSIHININQSLV